MANTITKALLALQAEGVELQKNAINPHFKNRYITLDQLLDKVLPLLNKHGLVLLQWPTALSRDTEKDGRVSLGTEPALRTKIIHVETGESMEDTMPLVLAKDDPQGQGSAITYARRYSLMSILGLVADEDNDAQGTHARTKAAKSQVVNAPAAQYAETGSL